MTIWPNYTNTYSEKTEIINWKPINSKKMKIIVGTYIYLESVCTGNKKVE